MVNRIMVRGRAGKANPAAVYAKEQGLEYEVRTDSTGGQYGVVTLPGGEERDAWEYYREHHKPSPPSEIPGEKIHRLREIIERKKQALADRSERRIPSKRRELKIYRESIRTREQALTDKSKRKKLEELRRLKQLKELARIQSLKTKKQVIQKFMPFGETSKNLFFAKKKSKQSFSFLR